MILVTGATGLVGTHLLRRLVQSGQKVRATYRSSIPSSDISNQVEWVRADILDILSIEEAMQQIQEVYHCAAVVSFNPDQKKQLQHVNVEGTANVVNAALDAGVQKMVFMSSVAALGRIREDVAIDESMNWTPETSNSEYGKSKYLAEMEVWRGIGEGLNAVIVNPVIILGAGDWSSGSTAIFKSAYDEFPWYTEGVSGFVDVEDVVTVMIELMKSNISDQRFIVSGANIPYRTIFNMIARGFGKKLPSRKVSPLMAAIVWRIEAIKSWFTGKSPLLTKETARTAQAKVNFNNTKLLKLLPAFSYTSAETSIDRICRELKVKYQLP
ncbi:NAD-dependent epimerase/dehydratase family protein [Sediminibacterium sp.]|jgi:dihydroflavonol-4-reductase|uniref:NAD-dependent epimerase/dehydratase family protein n=1 Tax=Sediminibacterium sp. TaxID=1917865 RepID=UPI0025D9CA74|nr:NAD-dependent epimerase/dehydratase family protein [Sediminibacterium sp.]MBW0177056.1 NAD-dependent epimerase/dehydratase family protein [Sediminibacterium sp.]